MSVCSWLRLAGPRGATPRAGAALCRRWLSGQGGTQKTVVPRLALSNGESMPALGMGTWFAEPGDVRAALEAGYTHIDCASVYGNQAAIGQVLATALQDGVVARGDLHVTSKLWNDEHGDPRAAVDRTMEELKLAHLDMYLVHWPFPNHHPPGVDASWRDPNATGFEVDAFMAVWAELEALVGAGRIRSLGVANMTAPKLRAILPHCTVPPVVNQIELHPFMQQPALVAFLREHGILPVCHTPLGSPTRPERDRSEDDPVVLEARWVTHIAERLQCSPAQVVLKWAMAQGFCTIPRGGNAREIAENLESVAVDITDRDIRLMRTLDRHHRIVKGHVFSWYDGQPWEELWDEVPCDSAKRPLPGATLCASDEVVEGGPETLIDFSYGISRPGFVLLRRDGQLRAYENLCPHKNIRLDFQGESCVDGAGTHLLCANHDAVFQAHDGLCTAGPCKGKSLIPVRVVEREVDGRMCVTMA